MSRRLAILAAAALLTAVTAPTASASPLIMECAGVSSVQATPGLTMVPGETEVTINTTYAACLLGEVSTGTSSLTTRGTASCRDLLNSGHSTKTITWNDRSTSTFSYEFAVSKPGAQAVLTAVGTITSGRFQGSTAVETSTGVQPNVADCLTPEGVTELTPVVTLTITRL